MEAPVIRSLQGQPKVYRRNGGYQHPLAGRGRWPIGPTSLRAGITPHDFGYARQIGIHRIDQLE